MKLNKTLDRILTFSLIIGVVTIISVAISELILNIKVVKRDNCLKIDGNYYCEVENGK